MVSLLWRGIYSSVLSIIDGPCPTQWRSFNKSCYKLVVNYTDIKECRKECFKEGADLASIHLQEENKMIVSAGGQPCLDSGEHHGGGGEVQVAGLVALGLHYLGPG